MSSMADVRSAVKRYFDEERPMTARDRRSLTVLASVLGGVGVAGFLFILWSVLNNAGLALLDEPVNRWWVERRSPALDGAMWFMSMITGPVFLPLFMLVLTVGWIWWGKHAWRPAMLAGGMSLGVLIAITIRETVDKPRPPLDLQVLFHPDQTFSFISGHTLGATNFALIGFYVLYSRRENPKTWHFWAGLAAALAWIGASASSRLYTGFHWFTDVAGSICVALAILGLVIAVDTRRTAAVMSPADVERANRDRGRDADRQGEKAP